MLLTPSTIKCIQTKTLTYSKTLIPDYLFTINIHLIIYVYIYMNLTLNDHEEVDLP